MTHGPVILPSRPEAETYIFAEAAQQRSAAHKLCGTRSPTCALPFSTSVVMWLMPYLTTTGFFLSDSAPFSRASASPKSRAFFAALSSGLQHSGFGSL